METSVTKWKRISTFVMANGHYKHFHNEATCKDKWVSLYGDYKKITNYMGVTSHNDNYWEMSIKDKVAPGLPKSFNMSYFDFIDQFMHNSMCFNLPHSQDSMNLEDDIYHAQPYLQKSSPYDDLEIKEKQMTKDTMKKMHLPLHLLIPYYIV
jgi:hypothetical protein